MFLTKMKSFSYFLGLHMTRGVYLYTIMFKLKWLSLYKKANDIPISQQQFSAEVNYLGIKCQQHVQA